jgi:hypothetical protein
VSEEELLSKFGIFKRANIENLNLFVVLLKVKARSSAEEEKV